MCQKSTSIKLNKVKNRNIRKIAKYLDNTQFTFGKSWIHLALLIFGNDETGLASVSDLRRKYSNGSPGNNLLVNLSVSKTNLTVEQFATVASDLGRNDMVDLLNKFSPDQSFYKVDDNILHEIIRLLDQTGSQALKNWRAFSEEFELEEKLIDAHVRFDGSPFEELVTLVKIRYPNYSLADLRQHLVCIDRPDAIECVDEIVKELSSRH